MKRVLVFGMTENPGGVESFLMNYYRHIDRSRLQFDFLCNTFHPVAYEEELESLGGRVYHIPARSEQRSDYYRALDIFFAENAGKYTAIWVNVCSLANIDYLKWAKKYGIRRRIIHSHNSRNMDSFLRGCLHRWNRGQVGKYATDFWACSEAAADWFYSGKLRQRLLLVPNAIDVEAYACDLEKRRRIRESLGWEDKQILGNIGRLHFQKNQTFLLEVFAKLVKKQPDARLVLVGEGEDEQKLRQLAREHGIEQLIFWAGLQKDIGAWLSSLDLFVFPSLFEGASVVALEAQANGVPCLVSGGVLPDEVCMNENFYPLSLEAGADAWAERALEILESGEAGTAPRLPKETVQADFQSCGYDIRTEAGKLEELFLAM